jgi:hypothetical protein
MTDTFEKLAEKLTTEQKLAFLRVLNQHGITVEADTVLSKFFLTLQIYVAMYEKIPESIDEATNFFQKAIQKAVADFQKPVASIAQLKTEIERLTRQADQSAKNAEIAGTHISQELACVDEALENINSSVKAGAEKASATVSERMTELLSAALKKAMPLSDLEEAGRTFSAAIRESEYASAELRANVKAVKRARFRTIATCAAVAVVFIILGTWGFFYSWSERRIEEARSYYVRQISGNDRIISELAKSKRELILTTDTDGSKLLAIEKATGLTRNNYGVIRFK